jgi:hypothetical protein
MIILGREFTDADARRVVWTALMAGSTAFPVLLAGLKSNPKAAALSFAIVVGSATLSAVKNWFLADESPLK